MVEADVMLVAIGVLGNVEGLVADDLKLEIVKNHIKVDPKNGYVDERAGHLRRRRRDRPALAGARRPSRGGLLRRAALRLLGPHGRLLEYPRLHLHRPRRRQRRPDRERPPAKPGTSVRIGKFPFMFSGRALASDETEGFVKLVFDEKYGELLGAHLIGSQATELIAELVMAKKLEATEEEILHAMHPHPTYSEAVMEAAGQGLGESMHI